MKSKENKNIDLISSLQQKKVDKEEKEVKNNTYNNFLYYLIIGKRR